MPDPDERLPEGTDQVLDGDGAEADLADETMFTPDEDPEEPASEAAADEPAPKASGGGSTTGATFGTSALFDRFDALKSEGYDRARDYAQQGIDRGASAIDDVVRMINEAADQIDERVGTQYGGYARRAAQGIGDVGEMVKGKDVDALFDQAREFIRKSPAIAMGTAAALGFVVARLARAGMPETTAPPRGTGAA